MSVRAVGLLAVVITRVLSRGGDAQTGCHYVNNVRFWAGACNGGVTCACWGYVHGMMSRGLLPAFLFHLEAMGDGRTLRSVVYGFPAMVSPNAFACYPTNNVYGIAYQLERPGIGLVFTWPCQ